MSVIATDTPRFSNVVKNELWPEMAYCRAVVTVNDAAATLKVGTVLGKTSVSGTGTVTAGGTNTGNGVFGAVTVSADAKNGTYTVTFTKAAAGAGDFQVTDPQGNVVGVGTVAVAFSGGGLSFTIAAGLTDFIVGDSFTIAVVVPAVKYKASVQTAIDGTATADAILIQEATVPANTDTKVLVLIKGPAAVSKAGLILDATYDLGSEKAAVYAALEAKGIKVLETV